MAEYFQVFNLDLQARIHYAPNDSRSHIAEQVMRSLNEATGDGRSIPVPRVPLFDGMTKEEIFGLSQDEFNDLENQRRRDISILCAKEISHRYEGKRCMGTTIIVRDLEAQDQRLAEKENQLERQLNDADENQTSNIQR